ncbi:spore coat U domain-containing protein [Bacillus subtilis]|uniref:Csu type fimbrial protein n=1 Tax=Pseudochrobactrum asaccharolyticum TaxID=354351 RepID=UPI001F1D2A06|nr:spore coat U domain-containing protein [Pseudochrobactrum asaccharolyticum]MCF7647234.1 spore coat U domain-containing protein [Pseudochrobactrum asaccharolyticum]MCF7673450.1 spore coat U domain-containing protein [Bacillus subtilis]
MMTIKQIMLGLSALALSASLTPAAYAATDTGTLTVKARIGAACTLKTKNATLDFGNLTTITDKDHDAETSITVQCSKGQAYLIGLNSGQNYDGIRQLRLGNNTIRYGLFKTAARLQTPQDYWAGPYGSFDNSYAKSATGDGSDQKHTIYGRIYKAAITPPAGDYTDTVAIEVTY